MSKSPKMLKKVPRTRRAMNQFCCSCLADLHNESPLQINVQINKTKTRINSPGDGFIVLKYYHAHTLYARGPKVGRMTVIRMKIGIYDPYLDDLGGGEKYMMTIAECLSKEHDVSVFWDKEEDMAALENRFLLDVKKVKLTKNIFNSQVSFFDKIRETQKYDCLIILSDGSIPFVLSKKLFLHIQQPLESLKVLSVADRVKFMRVNGIFYNSKFTKSYNDKVLTGVASSIIYPPVAIKSENVKKENIILHVGRFRASNVGADDYKKQGVMIEAFKKMVDREMVNGWKFIVASSIKDEDKETFAQLQKSAEGYPIEFFINKTNDELWKLYAKAKIYWHASGFGEDLEKHPSFAEHFGISTVEAMGAGAVPIVLNGGGQTEIVTDNENGLLWNTLSELEEKTEKVIKDHALWKNLSEKAMKRAKDFGKERFAESVKNLVTA